MISFRRWTPVFFALVLGAGRIFASGGSEDRDYAAAASAFQDGMWSRAEVEFAQFGEKYPKSGRVAEAQLMQAEADFKQGKLTQAMALLAAREPQAGDITDQYVYWIAEAQFQNTNYSGAAETFSRLARDFPNSKWRLDAVVNEAAARAKLGQWPQVSALLQKPNGVFQQATPSGAGDERVAGGRLLLAEALLAQNNPDAAAAVLQPPFAVKLKPELDWQRMYLLCRAELAGGDTNAALALTTNLIQSAEDLAGRGDLVAKSVSEQAGVLERLGRLSDAVSAYRQNLTPNAPAEWQRQAIMKTTELAVAQNEVSDAEQSLEKFLGQFPNAAAADVAMLTLGELHLKHYAGHPLPLTNDLEKARTWFNEFIGVFTNSPLLGKAYLDRGWCFWIAGDFHQSGVDFKNAAQNLPPSVDLAVARFKLGDALFQQNDYAGARENYETVTGDFTNFPVVGQSLGAQALYQTLRVCMDLNDVAGESNALAQILKIYPTSDLRDKGVLLVGESLSDFGQPASARTLFQKFEEKFPGSDLLPEIELAIARTYEQEDNWPAAIGIYDTWVGGFSTNTTLLPQVEYARAWANYKAGNETNAFALFSRFIAQFPGNGLAPVAQWWIGDHFSNAGDFVNAEKNYQLVFLNWPSNYFADPAKMMAGRAAMARNSPSDAIGYFTSLTSDTNCPPDLDAQARFAYGSALMLMPSSDTNNPHANFQEAILVFKTICTSYPGSEQAGLAQGEIGDCYYQLAAQAPHFYDDATNAYASVFSSNSPASATARSQAQVGFGLALEKKAALATGKDETGLLKLALDSYLDVFDTWTGKNLREGELADSFWVKNAGLHALPLVEALGMGDPNAFIDHMETLFPQSKDSFEKKRAALLSLPGKN